MALKMTIREANTLINNMLERNDNLYTAIEKEAIKRLLRNGQRIESHMVPKPWLRSHEVICVVCGKSFMTRRDDSKYCSQKCHNKASWERIKNDPKRMQEHREYNNNYVKERKKKLWI